MFISNRLLIIGFFYFFLAFSTLSKGAAGSLNVATITRIEGNVKILSNPSDKVDNSDSNNVRVLFEGKYYLEKNASLGDKLQLGHILQTSPDGKARLVYLNGDQITVGAGSAYRIKWGDEEAKSVLDLLFGKVRMMIKKKGPRAEMKVETKTAVMGVRGTDFHVLSYNKNGETEVSVFRGEVEVGKTKDKAKKISIPAGFTAAIPSPPSSPPPFTTPTKKTKPGTAPTTPSSLPKVEVQKEEQEIKLVKTTKQKLVMIQKESIVKKTPPSPEAKKQPAVHDQIKDIESLEKQALKTTLEDIKEEDPTLFEEIAKAPPKKANVDLISTMSIKKIFKKAPSEPKKEIKDKKPGEEVFEDLNDDAYEKYFKIDE